MAYPRFSHAGLADVVFSRGPQYGDDHNDLVHQIVGISEAGQVRVATLSDPDETLPLAFVLLPAEDIAAVRTFLSELNWAANTFTYVDVDSTAWTVRCLDATFTRSQTSSGRYSAHFQLRREH